MTDNRTYPISVFVNNLKGRFRYSPLNFRLTGGLKILIRRTGVHNYLLQSLALVQVSDATRWFKSRWFKSQT